MNYTPLKQFDVNIININNNSYTNSILFLTNLIATIILVYTHIVLLIWLVDIHFLALAVQNKIEVIYSFVYDLIFVQIKSKGLVYFPLFIVIFTAILGLNVISLFPYSFAVTSHFTWSMSLSLSLCLGLFFLGVAEHKLNYFKLFLQDIPLLLYPLMIAIELASYVIRAFSLAIRLSANIMAGHILVDIISEVIAYLNYFLIDIVWFLSGLLIALFFLEIGVACLQAYVFNLLLSLYFNDSVNLPIHF